jgi:type II secretory pathway component HofQ
MGFGAASLSAGEEEPQVLKRVEVIGGPAATDAGKVVGAEIQTIEVTERPLKQVLDYLSQISGKNIRCKKSKDERLPVTFKLEKVTYRTILDFIAKKYGMVVDDSMEKQNIILLDTPEKVSMVFSNADIRDVINTIAIQANANVVIDQDISGQVSMRLENVPWKSALTMVVKTRDYVAIDEPDNTIRITTPMKVEKQLEIKMFRLAYVSPEGSKYTPILTSDFFRKEEAGATQQGGAAASLIEVLKNVATAQGKIAFEKRSNTIVVRDTATALESMQQIITKLDVPPKQVHVAVKLVQVTDSDIERLGVDWSQGVKFGVTPLTSWASAFPFDVSGGLSRSLLGDATPWTTRPTRWELSVTCSLCAVA